MRLEAVVICSFKLYRTNTVQRSILSLLDIEKGKKNKNIKKIYKFFDSLGFKLKQFEKI